MPKRTPDCIRLRGVRQNNLKNIDLDVPLRKLVVISGLSGSGKSSLAFETLFAEGQRRYIETFSPYARQFLDRMDKPQARRIEGIPPAIAIEQRNSVKSTRSTVGTMTEITDYAKVVWAQLARLHCRGCGKPVEKEPPQKIWTVMRARAAEAETGPLAVCLDTQPMGGSVSGGRFRRRDADGCGRDDRAPGKVADDRGADALVTFTLDLSGKFSLEESLGLVGRQGYQRLLMEGEVVELDEALARLKGAAPDRLTAARDGGAAAPPYHEGSVPARLTVVQDRVKLKESNRGRFVEACEQAYHFGQGKLAVHLLGKEGGILETSHFSNRLHCAGCDLEYREPSPALFSFNHPAGACPACKGFGRIIAIDYNAAIPDRSKTLAGGAVKPWQTKTGLECQMDMLKFARLRRVPVDVAFRDLPKEMQDWVVEGDPGYGQDKAHEWPRAWYGVKGYFRWLESKAYKMHVRVLLARYRKYNTCPDCHGARFQPETLLYKIDGTEALRIANPPSPGYGAASCGLRIDGTEGGGGADIGGGHGAPLQEEGGGGLTLADFYRLPVTEALRFVDGLIAGRPGAKAPDPRRLALNEVRSRLAFLLDAGLGYLCLDRMTRSLSGGETERVALTSCLGSRLVNTLFVLDEPSVGLHARDTARLVGIVRQLRDAGNTVAVVEHEASVMRAADQIIDLGPGHGASGGEVVFQGTYQEILRAPQSLTGQYLAGKKRIEIPARRPVSLRGGPAFALASAVASGFGGTSRGGEPGGAAVARLRPGKQSIQKSGAEGAVLILRRASLHNLKDLTVEIPLGRLVCVTGVSGSGKSTLVRDVLLPALRERLAGETPASQDEEPASETQISGGHGPPLQDDADAGEKEAVEMAAPPSGSVLEGWKHLGRVVAVDQSLLGRTPRSNPAVYIGAFDEIRELFARTAAAGQRGLKASAFSFNSAQGQCERCRGAGFEKIEMQFLSDVFVRCPDCNGRRYRAHILEITAESGGRRRWNIAELLEATVDEAIEFLNGFGQSRHAARAAASLKLLQEVGLGYVRLGQPINTLSGGESQRLKLVSHLAEGELRIADGLPSAGLAEEGGFPPALKLPPSPGLRRTGRRTGRKAEGREKPALFIFDEPTTGLHFEDVRVLLKVFQRLVGSGHSLLVIEHNLDVIKSADWVIDLGPEGGDGGGRIVAQGTPEEVAASPQSHTGKALGGVLFPDGHNRMY